MKFQRYGMVSDGKRYHAMKRDDAGEYVEAAAVEKMESELTRVEGMYQDASRAAADAGQIRDAYRNFIANKCLEYGFSPPLEMPFNRMVDELIERVKKSVSQEDREKLCPVCRRKFIPLEGDKSICARCFSDYVEQEAKRRAVASDAELP